MARVLSIIGQALTEDSLLASSKKVTGKSFSQTATNTSDHTSKESLTVLANISGRMAATMRATLPTGSAQEQESGYTTTELYTKATSRTTLKMATERKHTNLANISRVFSEKATGTRASLTTVIKIG